MCGTQLSGQPEHSSNSRAGAPSEGLGHGGSGDAALGIPSGENASVADLAQGSRQPQQAPASEAAVGVTAATVAPLVAAAASEGPAGTAGNKVSVSVCASVAGM